MQKANMKKGFIFLPVPAEVAQELNLDPFGTIQYTIYLLKQAMRNLG